MDLKEHATPSKLEYYSFIWSEARLVVAAVALLLGGVPPILFFLSIPFLYGVLSVGLKISWIVSGVASAYLAYRWYKGGQTIFGGKDQKDLGALLVSVVSGINLGLTGLFNTNIGMSMVSWYPIFVAAAVLYLAAAYHLYRRWNASGRKVF